MTKSEFKRIFLVTPLTLCIAGGMGSSLSAGDATIEIIAAPGGGFGTDHLAFTTARINATGQVQFVARHDDAPDPTYSAIYIGVPGSLAFVVREGPFDSGTTYLFDLELSGATAPINDAGEIFLYHQMGGQGITFDNDRRISVGGTLCAAEEGVAPGTGGLLFRSLNSVLPRINNLGTTAFKGELEAGVPSDENGGIWICGSGGTSLHAREGDAAPGFPAGAEFFLFDNVSTLNDADQVLFRARTTGGGVDSTNDAGFWLGTVGAPALVVREGDPVPGVTGDVNFGSLSDWGVVNNAGQLAFFTLLTGTDVVFETNNCIMTGTSGNLSMAARKGDVAPGTGGAVFSFLEHPVIDGAGRIAFRAILAGTGVDSTNDRGIWTGLPGALTLVAREGSVPPEADPGDVFSFLYQPVMNALGQVAFGGTYLNGGLSYKGIWATDTNGALTEVIRQGDLIDLGGGDLRTALSPELEHRSNIGSGGQDGRPRCLNDAGQLAFDVSFTDGMKAIVRAILAGGGPTPCPADVDDSGAVNIQDLLDVLATWGVCPPPCPTDVNVDGTVNISDLLAILAAWGSCP